jgi:hypothetical protein
MRSFDFRVEAPADLPVLADKLEDEGDHVAAEAVRWLAAEKRWPGRRGRFWFWRVPGTFYVRRRCDIMSRRTPFLRWGFLGTSRGQVRYHPDPTAAVWDVVNEWRASVRFDAAHGSPSDLDELLGLVANGFRPAQRQEGGGA